MALPQVPASFFGMVLGLAGLGNGWRIAARVWGLPPAIGESVLALAATVWATLMVLYARKWLVARDAALSELRHEVQAGFVALVPLTTMLMAMAAAPHARPLAIALFLAGVAGQLALGAYSTGRLWQGGRDPATTTTVLYLPTVGVNFVAAMAAGTLGYPGWGALFFGVGALAWLSLESVILQRHAQHPLPVPLRATLGIQLAPPVVGAMAYLSITPGPGGLLVQALFGYSLFHGLMLLRMVPWFRAQPFGPGLWAFTFGITAIANVPMTMIERGGTGPHELLALPLFVFANLFIGLLALGTVRLALQGRLLAAPPPQTA